jgi:hypothetical protein
MHILDRLPYYLIVRLIKRKLKVKLEKERHLLGSFKILLELSRNAPDFFSPIYDKKFQIEHPFAYGRMVFLAIVALMGPGSLGSLILG